MVLNPGSSSDGLSGLVFPVQGDAIKSWFEMLRARTNPDLILTHHRDDAHEDHRRVSADDCRGIHSETTVFFNKRS